MIRLVERQHRAYNRRNLDEFCLCFHPEVVVVNLMDNRTTRGLTAFRAGYRTLFESNSSLHCEVVRRTILTDTIIDEEWVTGASKYPDGLHAAAIYGFKNGLIDRVWFVR